MVFLVLAGCIEPYTPNLHGEAENIYVISGEVTSKEGYQTVYISKAAPIEQPLQIPVIGGYFSPLKMTRVMFSIWKNIPPVNTGCGSISNSFMPGISYRLHILLSEG